VIFAVFVIFVSGPYGVATPPSIADTMFAEIKSQWPWRPIPNCPGRFVFATGPTRVTPAEIASHTIDITEHVVAFARDPIVVIAFDDGGLISYRKPDGSYVHTLNTREGFDRKLQQLGIG
jgi:hypothetical protein